MIVFKERSNFLPNRIKSQALPLISIENFIPMSTPADKDVLNSLGERSNRHEKVFPSQSTLAHDAHITREHCNRTIKKLEGLGLMKTIYRPYSTLEYRLHPIFFHLPTRQRLAQWLPSLKVVTFLVVCMFHNLFGMESQKNMSSTENVTLLKNNIKDLERDSNTYTSKSPDLSSSTRLSLKQNGKKEKSELWVRHPRTGKDIPLPFASNLFPIKGIELTVWAMIRLTCFPNQAIKHARVTLKDMNPQTLEDPYNWLFRHCLAYCIREGIEPDYDYATKLTQRHNVPFDAPMIRTRSYHPPLGNSPIQIRRESKPEGPKDPSVIDKLSATGQSRYLKLDQAVREDVTRLEIATAAVAPEKKNTWLTMFPVPDHVKQNTGNHKAYKKEEV
jgi:hypothetical protein